MNTLKEHNLTLPNDVESIPQLAAFIEAVTEELAIAPQLTMRINLAMEEAVVNVMKYAYPEGTLGQIDISTSFSDGTITFAIKDSGIPFDPTKVSSPDISLPVEERSIGGLGIYLVRELMDEVSYCYKNNHNILTLKKKIQ